MNNLDKQYEDLIKDIVQNGTDKGDRTGTGTRSITGAMIKHNMSEGFPAITTKKLFFKTMSVELEGFIKGITDKQWFKDRGCNIWNEWANPNVIPKNLTDEERKKKQLQENDLGPIYGYQWRSFNKPYKDWDREGKGFDQLQAVINSLENNPNDRRMLVSAWNPNQLNQQALPPCHILWQVVVRGEYLDLLWYQRSVDVGLGLPFNIASYGLLLSLLAKQFNYKPGILTGFLADTHIYNNHMDQIREQLSRKPFDLPQLEISDDFTNIKTFDHTTVKLVNYQCHPPIKAPIAI